MDIFLTAEIGNYDDFFKLYEKKYLNEVDKYDGESLIVKAMENTDKETRYKVVNFLLDEGASATDLSEGNLTLLHLLLVHVDHNLDEDIALAKRLIDLGVDINIPDRRNRLAISAVINLNKFRDEELIPLYDVFFNQAYVDVSTKNDWGYSPLDLARKTETRPELVKRMEEALDKQLGKVE